MRLLRDIKRAVSQLFEREYWYSFRRLPSYWLDDDGKWKEGRKHRALDVTNSTWNGDYDMLEAMLLKVDHMFWNLHKHSAEKDYYFFASDILKYGNESDKDFIVKKILKSMAESPGAKIWLYNAECSRDISESGKLSFYLQYDKESRAFDLVLVTQMRMSEAEEKAYNKKHHSYKLENGNIVRAEDVKRYKTKLLSYLDVWQRGPDEKPEDFAFDTVLNEIGKPVSEYFAKMGIEKPDGLDKISYKELLLKRIDTNIASSVDFEISDMPKLSAELKEHAVGSFVKCKNILHIRRLLKKAIRYCDDSDAYGKDWVNIQDDDERERKTLELRDAFYAARKRAFVDLAEYLSDVGMSLWD